MSRPFLPEKGVLITALMTNDKNLFASALKDFENKFGDCFLVSPWFEFSHSKYYENEMGENLLKRFICFKNPLNQDSLPDVKNTAYEIENRYLQDNKRKINIDPGILTPDKYVLSTFKNFSHRIYLGDKVFAEVEFIFKNNEPAFFEWTYPDYRQREVCEFFMTARRYLLLLNSVKT
jgi:hypothetical protein